MSLIQKSIQESKTYNVSDIFIGQIAKRRVGKDGKLGIAKIIDSKLRIFRYASMDYFRDIENNEYYPLIGDGDSVNNGGYYIPERLLKKNTEDFHELLEINGVGINDKLTIAELRRIVDNQQQKLELMF